MKRRHLLPVAFVTVLATVFTAFAMATLAKADAYQYTVRVFPGNRGTLSPDPVVVHVNPGDDVDLYKVATATITDDKYVQTGFRLSGTDKLIGGDCVIKGVTEDMDYVVAYGVEADLVEYTLQFVEYGTGRELAKPKTYYGRAGDKPVAAYEHVEGYRPLYLAITGTLLADEENVWTFEYTPLEEGETVVVTTTTTNTNYVTLPTTTTVTETGGTTGGTTTTTETTGGAAGQAAAGGQAAGGQAAAGNEAAAGGQAAPGAEGTAGGATEPEAAPQTQEILDLDTPLAGPGATQNPGAAPKAEKSSHLLTNPVVIAGVAIAMVLGLGILLYLASRKKKEEENEEA